MIAQQPESRSGMMVAAPTSHGTFVGFVQSIETRTVNNTVVSQLSVRSIRRGTIQFPPELKWLGDIAGNAVRAADARRGYVLVLMFRGIPVFKSGEGYPARPVIRTALVASRRSSAWLKRLKDRVGAAQKRAWQLRCARGQRIQCKPVPLAIVKKAVQEVFPKSPMPLPDWLAHVSRECGDSFAKAHLKEWIDASRYDLVAQYINFSLPAAERWTGRTMRKSLWWFLLTNWHRFGVPGMTATKAHEMATRYLGPNNVGTLKSFQHVCTRNGLRFHPPHAPKK